MEGFELVKKKRRKCILAESKRMKEKRDREEINHVQRLGAWMVWKKCTCKTVSMCVRGA